MHHEIEKVEQRSNVVDMSREGSEDLTNNDDDEASSKLNPAG